MNTTTIKQAAESLDCSSNVILEGISKGYIPVERTGRHLLLDDYAIEVIYALSPKTPSFYSELMGALVDIVGSGLTTREHDIVMRIINNDDINDISKDFGLTRERVRQISCNAVKKIAAIVPYSDVVKENADLKSKNEALKEGCEKLMAENRLLKKEQEDEAKPFTKEDLKTIKILQSKVEDDDFRLSRRALNCLRAADIETIGDLVKYGKTDLLRFRNMGKKTLSELDTLILSNSLSWNMDTRKLMKRYSEYLLSNGQ